MHAWVLAMKIVKTLSFVEVLNLAVKTKKKKAELKQIE